ncbi:MAG: hypothetical protein HPM95_05600 [Alphaproteobacteria bacterium]|nr:hypothetical protein [Alphaproteobacteria bacterium]
MMDRFGPSASFVYTATLHLAFVGFWWILRLVMRNPVPADRRKRFVWLCATLRRSSGWRARPATDLADKP